MLLDTARRRHRLWTTSSRPPRATWTHTQRKVSGVTLDETLLLAENSMTIRGTVPQRVSSDLILLNVGGEILGMRDVYAVDTKAVRPKEPRIARVLAEPDAGARGRPAQLFAREHAVYLRSNVVLWFSDPALVMRCLQAKHRARLTFKLEGSKRMNGAQVYGLGFKETDKDPAKLDSADAGRPAGLRTILGGAGHGPHSPDGILAAVRHRRRARPGAVRA